MNFSIAIGFVVLVVPLLVIMMGMVIYTDNKAKEVDLETNEN